MVVEALQGGHVNSVHHAIRGPIIQDASTRHLVYVFHAEYAHQESIYMDAVTQIQEAAHYARYVHKENTPQAAVEHLLGHVSIVQCVLKERISLDVLDKIKELVMIVYLGLILAAALQCVQIVGLIFLQKLNSLLYVNGFAMLDFIKILPQLVLYAQAVTIVQLVVTNLFVQVVSMIKNVSPNAPISPVIPSQFIPRLLKTTLRLGVYGVATLGILRILTLINVRFAQ